MSELPMRDPERVILLAPTAKDAELTCSILAEAAIACDVCADLAEASREVSAGGGAVLLTEAVIGDRDIDSLIRVLHEQPAWSDIPVIVLSGPGVESLESARTMEL